MTKRKKKERRIKRLTKYTTTTTTPRTTTAKPRAGLCYPTIHKKETKQHITPRQPTPPKDGESQ